MKRILSLLLSILLFLSLLSCGTTPSKEPNTPSAPESTTPARDDSRDAYPKALTLAHGQVLCDLLESVEAEQQMQFVQDEATVDAYRKIFDEYMLEQFRSSAECPDSVLSMTMDIYVRGVNALSIGKEEDFFGDNTLLLISVPFHGHNFVRTDCSLILDENGEEKLELKVIKSSDDQVQPARYTLVVALPNALGMDCEDKISVTVHTEPQS